MGASLARLGSKSGWSVKFFGAGITLMVMAVAAELSHPGNRIRPTQTAHVVIRLAMFDFETQVVWTR
jgi:hypothetical protein